MNASLEQPTHAPITPHVMRPVLLLLLCAAVLVGLGLRQGDRPAPHADVTRLPAVLGTWHLSASEATNPKELGFSATDLAALALDSWTQRVYTDTRTGRQVMLRLEYRTLGRGAFNHRPEACYPAVGYVLTGRREVPITYGGTAQKAVTLTADYQGASGTRHQTLLYWFARGSQTETSFWRQQAQMALGRLQPDKNGWAFVSIVCENDTGDDAAALAAEQDFAQQASPAMIAAVAPVHTAP